MTMPNPMSDSPPKMDDSSADVADDTMEEENQIANATSSSGNVTMDSLTNTTELREVDSDSPVLPGKSSDSKGETAILSILASIFCRVDLVWVVRGSRDRQMTDFA